MLPPSTNNSFHSSLFCCPLCTNLVAHSSLRAPPAGCDSVVALGTHAPDAKWNGGLTHAELNIDGNIVKVAQVGKGGG